MDNHSDKSLEGHQCVYNSSGWSTSKVEDFSGAHYMLRGPVLSCVVFVGLFGNFVSLTVFCNQKTSLKICNYLITLEIWNSILLFGSLLLYSLPTMINGRYPISGPYVVLYPPLYTLTNVAYVGSVWSVVLLAVERYFALCKPFAHLKFDGERRTRVLLTATTLLVVLYQCPRFFEFFIQSCYDFASGDTTPFLRLSDLQTNANYVVVYKIACGLLFQSVGPMFFLSSLSLSVWIRVKQCDLERRRLSSEPLTSRQRAGRRNRQMDRIMLTVVCKFAACHVIPTLLDVFEISLNMETFHTYVVETFLSDVANLLVCVNSSCNFVIYYMCSQSFRCKVKRTFCRSCVGRRFGVYGGIPGPPVSESDRTSSF